MPPLFLIPPCNEHWHYRLQLPSTASVLVDAEGCPTVLFFSSPLSYCFFSQKELCSSGYGPKIIEASPNQRRVSDLPVLSNLMPSSHPFPLYQVPDEITGSSSVHNRWVKGHDVRKSISDINIAISFTVSSLSLAL